MKCSSQRNCNPTSSTTTGARARCLNEVQLLRELQQRRWPGDGQPLSLNEVQFLRELQPSGRCVTRRASRGLNEVQLLRELQLTTRDHVWAWRQPQ